MDKRTETGLLLDCYGALLTNRQRSFMEAHFDEDLSLAEIAEREGISRQAVRDALVKAEEQLRDYETKLGLLARDMELARELRKIMAECDAGTGKALRKLLERIEGSDGV